MFNLKRNSNNGPRAFRLRLALVLLPLLWVTAARAELHFPYVDPETGAVQDIYFTPEEMSLLRPLIDSAVEPSAPAVVQTYRTLPASLQQKLRTLSDNDMSLHMNPEAKMLEGQYRIRPLELRKLRALFFDQAAKGVVEALRKDPKAQVRLLGRDMNEVYQRTLSLLSPENQELGLNKTEKAQLIPRVKLPVASRDLVRTIHFPDQLKRAFQISPSDEASGDHFLLIDGGYYGEIPRNTKATFQAAGLGDKTKWYFLFKHPQAPADIGLWDNGQGVAKLTQLNPVLSNSAAMANPGTSFRVSGVEHQPKWTAQTVDFAQSPVYLMLDLDDTVLKEIPVGKYKGKFGAQAITYTPSAEAYAKYQGRLNAPPAPGKVIHYELLPGGQMVGYVTVRPSMDQLFKEVEPLIRSGALKILVTSANDPQRTQAMVQQLKVGGKTLADWGAVAVPSEKFSPGRGIKDMSMLRRNLQITPDSKIVALDDLPNNIINPGANDRIIPIRPWNHDVLYPYLDQSPAFADFALEDAHSMRAFHDLIYGLTLNTKNPVSQENRVRVVGQLMRLAGTVPECVDNLGDLARRP